MNVFIWYPFPAHFLLMVGWVFQSYFMSVLVDHLQEVLRRGLRMGRVKRYYSQHTIFTGWNWTGISSGCLSIIVSVNLFLSLTGACYLAWRSYFSFYMHLTVHVHEISGGSVILYKHSCIGRFVFYFHFHSFIIGIFAFKYDLSLWLKQTIKIVRACCFFLLSLFPCCLMETFVVGIENWFST